MAVNAGLLYPPIELAHVAAVLEAEGHGVAIVDADGESLQDYYLPENSYLNVEDGTEVKAGS